MKWDRIRQQNAMNRNGYEPAAGPLTKDALRREADRLLAGYAGPVTRVPEGNTTGLSPNPVSADRPQMRDRRAKLVIAKKHGKSKGSQPRRVFTESTHAGRAVPAGLVIYADGACEPNPGLGGWGFAVYRDGVEIHSACGGDDPTTNNIMELTGVLMALRWAAGNAAGEEVRLFCDSRYVVNGCNDWRHGWKRNGWNKRKPNSPKRDEGEIKNLGLWQEIDAVLTARPLKLEWCRGHVGIVGNERADELSLIGREAVTGVSSDDGLDAIRQQLRYEVF